MPLGGKRWRDRAEEIRALDGYRCVRCGAADEPTNQAARLQVDHILPRRLLVDRPDVVDLDINLASLCPPCHAVKTHRYEPRILRGDMLAIEDFYGRAVRFVAVEVLNGRPEGLPRWGDG